MVACNRQQLGQQAEQAACRFLESKGMRLLLQNYHCRFGEIDLIMQDQDDIVFVEVRSRSRVDYGSAGESITNSKIKKLGKTAVHFLQKKNWLYKFASRFDVIAIHTMDNDMQIEWIKNAFSVER